MTTKLPVYIVVVHSLLLAITITKTKTRIELLHIHPFIISLVKTKRTELNKILT